MKNMEIWEKVCKTDPANTKKVDTRGGFTSVCAQSQVKAATALFGAYGFGWGVQNLTWSLIPDPLNPKECAHHPFQYGILSQKSEADRPVIF